MPEINQQPQSLTISGANDWLVIDHNNGDGTFTTKKVRPNLVAGLSTVTTATALEFIASANVGYPLNTGMQGYLVAPYSGVINSYTLLANISGDLVLDIWKCPAVTFDAGVTHPVSGDSICGGTLLTLSSASIATGATPAAWTADFNAGEILAFNIVSTDRKISQITLALNVTKTSIP
jgi:hypothetical protein